VPEAMRIHEFQTKHLLASYGIPVDVGVTIGPQDDAETLISSLGNVESYIVKAQIHSGGRGKGHFVDGAGGGVQRVYSRIEAAALVRRMLNNSLVTMQTGVKGRRVRKVYVGPGINFRRQFYLAVFMDRQEGKPVVMVSAAGGVEIEENPENILREHVCPLVGLQTFQVRKLAYALGLESESLCRSFAAIAHNLYRLFWEKDASLIEINPLVETEYGQLLAIDGKATFDDNGLFRHGDIQALRDPSEEDAKEIQAAAYGINYVALEGDVGCLTNGAGLAMATMDLLKANGLAAANFFDLGDNSGEDAIRAAFEILLQDDSLRCLLINIFGGAMRGDMVARCAMEILSKNSKNLPLVVRMEGANAEEGLGLFRAKMPYLSVAQNLWDIPIKIKTVLKQP
jgi:succinyl-CoA synthetase beta subunit